MAFLNFLWSLFLHGVALGMAVFYLLICAMLWKGIASYIQSGSVFAAKLNPWMPLITYGGTAGLLVFGLISPGFLILSSIVATVSVALLLLIFAPALERRFVVK